MVFFFQDRNTLGLSEGQAREFVEQLRQGIGSELNRMIARVGAMRVKNTKIICYLKDPSSSNCKQIREAMCAYIERENIKLGGATLFVVEEKPVWRQEQQKTLRKALGVAEHYAKNSGNTFLQHGTHSIKCMFMNQNLHNQFLFYQQRQELRL